MKMKEISQFNINESLYKEDINQINYDNEYIYSLKDVTFKMSVHVEG